MADHPVTVAPPLHEAIWSGTPFSSTQAEAGHDHPPSRAADSPQDQDSEAPARPVVSASSSGSSSSSSACSSSPASSAAEALPSDPGDQDTPLMGHLLVNSTSGIYHAAVSVTDGDSVRSGRAVELNGAIWKAGCGALLARHRHLSLTDETPEGSNPCQRRGCAALLLPLDE